jgi:hypothetical protein
MSAPIVNAGPSAAAPAITHGAAPYDRKKAIIEQYDAAPATPEELEAVRALSIIQANAYDIYRGDGEPMGFRFRFAGNLEVSPPQWLVRDFMEENTFAVVYGASGEGKTFLALDLAASVATGNAFHGREVVRPGLVVYIAGEGHAGLARRLRAWSIDQGVPLGGAPLIVSYQATTLCEPEAIAEVEKAIAYHVRTLGPPRLLIFDTWSRNLGGDENSSLDSAEGVAAVDRIRRPYGSTALVVHHTGHDTSRARGSTVLRAAADLELQVEKSADEVIRVTATKIKDSGPPSPLAFKLRDVDLGIVDDKGWPVKKAVLDEIEYTAETKRSNAPSGKNQKKALEILAGMIASHRANLRASGRPESEARVLLTAWRDDCMNEGVNRKRFSEAKADLLSMKAIETDGPFVIIPELSGKRPDSSGFVRD